MPTSDKKDIALIYGKLKMGQACSKLQKKAVQSCPPKKLLKIAHSPLMFLGIALSEALKVLLPLVGELVLPEVEVRRGGSSDCGVSVRERVRGVPRVVERGVARHHWVLLGHISMFDLTVFLICIFLVTQNKYITTKKKVS